MAPGEHLSGTDPQNVFHLTVRRAPLVSSLIGFSLVSRSLIPAAHSNLEQNTQNVVLHSIFRPRRLPALETS